MVAVIMNGVLQVHFQSFTKGPGGSPSPIGPKQYVAILSVSTKRRPISGRH